MLRVPLVIILLAAVAVEQSQAGCWDDKNCDAQCGGQNGHCGGSFKERNKGQGYCHCSARNQCVFNSECKGKITCPKWKYEYCSGGSGAFCMCMVPGQEYGNVDYGYQP